MKYILLCLLCLSQLFTSAQANDENYPVDSASIELPGVAKGELIKLSFDKSAIFPGTSRDYWVYVPAQYTPDKPACVYVGQDGVQFKAPTVFDNLIAKKEMPVTIGVFVTPGQVHAANGATALDRYNRSFEYDGLGDAYARFILNEILPEVEKQKTSDGRVIKLSKNGNDRCIGGSSSGAVCAFTAAWEHPEAFSKVFSSIGTYVSLRGADRYPGLIRKYEPKPIRIFLQDGQNDLNIYGGDWWKANESMERALTFAGYEVQHVWGEGGHNGKQATALFPQAMRWLWKNYPDKVISAISKNPVIAGILIPGEDWQLVGENYGFTEGTAVNVTGEVFFQDIPNSKTYKVTTDGKLSALNIDAKNASGTAFGPDGKRYTVSGKKQQVIRYENDGKETIIADSVAGNDVAVANNGNVYVTAPDGSEKPGKLFLINAGGKKILLDEGLKFPNGLTLTPDQTQLYVTESASHWVWLYQILPDGKLAAKQQFGWLHMPDNASYAWPDGLRCDTSGKVYVATNLGIQILDQTGRVNAILPLPSGQASNVCFGGADFNILYVTAGSKVYRRKLNVRGVNLFQPPIKPVKPNL